MRLLSQVSDKQLAILCADLFGADVVIKEFLRDVPEKGDVTARIVTRWNLDEEIVDLTDDVELSMSGGGTIAADFSITSEDEFKLMQFAYANGCVPYKYYIDNPYV